MTEMPDIIISLQSLIKKNDGLFRSAKQAAFLCKRLEEGYSDFMPKYAGIEEEGQFASWTGYVRWADYGTRSLRPYGWVYKYDSYGIVKAWKLKWQGDMRSGTSVDPKGTKLIFERPADVDLTELNAQFEAIEDAQDKEVANSEFVGTVGEKFEGDVEVTHTYMTHSHYGSSLMIGMQDDSGNKMLWFSTALPDVEKGDKLHIKGRVKKHDLYKGIRQTTLTRCKIL